MNRFGGKVVAVAGGASWIGEATVRRFVEDGTRVSFADRDAARGRQVAAEIEAQSAVVRFVEADVGEEAEATGFVESTTADFGRLDVLVDNAALRRFQAVTEAGDVPVHRRGTERAVRRQGQPLSR